MKSTLFTIFIGIVVVVLLVPAYAAGTGGSDIPVLELQKVYSGLSPDIRFPSGFGGPDSVLPAWSGSGSSPKALVIQQLKNQTFAPALPANGLEKPLPTPTPVPTPGYTVPDPSKYYDGPSKESLILQYSSQKAAMLNSLQVQTGTKATTSVTQNGKMVIQANNQFALDLYSRLASEAGTAGGNMFFSPWSISSALAITYEGARGTTADEIQEVFHFPADDATRRTGFYELSTGLNRGGSGYTLRTANALWAEKTYSFLPAFISTARNSYSAYVTNLDFIGNPEASRTTINQWVAGQTENRIKDLLPPGSIDPLTRLVITNAIYFKGTWDKQFDKENTVEDTFRVSPSQTVPVQMMRKTDEDAKYWYAETDTLQVLGMPYAHKDGKALSMLVLLPKDGNLQAAEQSLTAQELAELQQALVYKRVMVYFPRFRLETDYCLSDTLKEMGMPTAFTGGADFSGMDGTGGLWIDDVFHKAFVDVNEEGTEAAAATAVAMTLAYESSFEPIPVFRADHPFIFLIQDDDTGNILFIGRVVNPNGG
jgi:serpin B